MYDPFGVVFNEQNQSAQCLYQKRKEEKDKELLLNILLFN
jgi:hypothetical protein